MRQLPSKLLVITDRHQARLPIDKVVEAIADGGVRWVLFRDKDLDPVERRSTALSLSALARQRDISLSVSADIDLAAEINAAGVHLQSANRVADARRQLGERAIVGVSAHNVADVEAAAIAGADYVTLSPIFITQSKPGYGPALGPDSIRPAASLGIPIFALGGITARSAALCQEAGAYGVAVMGEVMRAENPRQTIGGLLHAIGEQSLRAPSAEKL